MNWPDDYIDMVLCGDHLDVMEHMPRHCVDMILCDLPYGQTANAWDSSISLPRLWEAYEKVVQPDAAIVLTAMQPFASELVCSNPAAFKHEWIWEKNKSTGFLNSGIMPLRKHESVLVFSYGRPPYNPIMLGGYSPIHGMRHVSLSSTYGKHTFRLTEPGSTLRHPSSVLHFNVVNNDSPERVHPTQKPVVLFQYLIETYSQEGGIVLDNCIGSGTTAIAAMRTARKFIAIEISEGYCEIARGRIEKERAQLVFL